MAAPVKLNFKVYQGSTFREVLRWESSTKTYTPITQITKTAPVVVTAVAHGLPAGWRAKITGVVGMKEINDSENYRVATSTTTDTVTFNAVNATGYTTYTSGGVLEYNTPVDLANYTARMQIRPTLASTTIIQELTTSNGGIALDNSAKTVTILMSAAQTTLFTFTSAVYSLELVLSGTEVVPFCGGNITLIPEVTR
jgi:hypothetical protein